MTNVPRAYLQINNKKYFLYENEHNTIGRNPKARVNIKSLNVSQLHSCITIIDSKHFISDFNSTNNTFLNETKLDPYKLYDIIPDDEIKFGDVISTYKCLNPNETSEIQFGESQSMSQTFYKTSTQNMMENTHVNNTINQVTTQLIEYGDNMTTQDFFPSINDAETQKIVPSTHISINEAATQRISIDFNEAATQLLPTCFNKAVTQKICFDNIDDSGRHTPDDLNEEDTSILQNDQAASSAEDDVQQKDESNDSLNFITETSFNDAITQKISIHNINENSRHTPDHLNEEEMPILQDDEVVNSRKDETCEDIEQQRGITLNNKPGLAEESNDSLNFIAADINDEVTQRVLPDETSRDTPDHLNEEEMPVLYNDEVIAEDNICENTCKGLNQQKEIILNNKPDILDGSSNDSLELLSKSFINNMNKKEIQNSTPQKILEKSLPETEKSGNYSSDADDTDIEDNLDNQTVNDSNIIPGTQLANQSILTETKNNESTIDILPDTLSIQPEESSELTKKENAKNTAENDVEDEKQQEYIESAELKETDSMKNSENDEALLSRQETKLNISDAANSDHDYYLMPTQEMPQSSFANQERKFSFKKPNSVLKMNASMEKLISDDEELYYQSTQKMHEDPPGEPPEKEKDDKELYNKCTQKMTEEFPEEPKKKSQSGETNNINCPATQKLENGERDTEGDLFDLPPTQALEEMFNNIEDNSAAQIPSPASNVEKKQRESIGSAKLRETEIKENPQSTVQKSHTEDDLFYLPPTQALEKMYHNIEDSTPQIPSSGSSVEEQFEMMFATQSETREEEAFPATQQLVTILEDKGDDSLMNSINESVDIIDNSVVEMSMASSRRLLKSVSIAKAPEEDIPATQDLAALLESGEVNVSKLKTIENKAEAEATNNVQVPGTSAKVTRKRKSADDVVKSVSSPKRKRNQTVIGESAQAVAGNSRSNSRQSTVKTRAKKIIESSDSEEDFEQNNTALPEAVVSISTDSSKASLQKTVKNKTIISEETLTKTRNRKQRLTKRIELSDSEEDQAREIEQRKNVLKPVASNTSIDSNQSRQSTVSKASSNNTVTSRTRKTRSTRKISSESEEDVPEPVANNRKSTVSKSLTNKTVLSGETSSNRTMRTKRKIESSDSEEDLLEPVARKSTASKTVSNKTVIAGETLSNRTMRSKKKSEANNIENDQNKEETIQPKRTTTKKSSSGLPMMIDLKVPKKTTRKEPEPKPAKISRKMSINNIEMPLTPSRSRRQLKPKVVFSMMDNPELESAVRHLGGLIVDTVDASTVLVTENVKRSQKLLCAIGQGKPICNPQWIHESKKQYSFLDPWDFIIVDKEAEKKWNFSMKESILRGTKEKLLEDYTFQVMVNAGGDCLKGAIEACGGKCVTRNLGKATTSHIMIVSTPENQAKYAKIIKQNSKIKVVLPEAIFEGALRQEYNFDKYVVF